jgi:acetylornithine deacetylase/succinyl-diaminopimelate desuccinylase-like protein
VDLEPVYAAIDRQLEDTTELLRAYLRQPSISIDSVGLEQCAQLLADRYRELGCSEVEVVETGGAPAVWAYFDAGAPLTIVNYDMYDVRPVGDESTWRHPPFEAVVEDGEGFPRVVYGRGACVPKGPSTAWYGALRAIVSVAGTLPVNIAFLAEGDEILGSPGYGALVERYRERLRGIDGCLYLRATQNLEGELPLVLGYKGLLTIWRHQGVPGVGARSRRPHTARPSQSSIRLPGDLCMRSALSPARAPTGRRSMSWRACSSRMHRPWPRTKR